MGIFSIRRNDARVPDGPSPEEYRAGAAMDPADRLATLLQRCSHWPIYRADREMRDALVGLAEDYKRLRDRVKFIEARERGR